MYTEISIAVMKEEQRERLRQAEKARFVTQATQARKRSKIWADFERLLKQMGQTKWRVVASLIAALKERLFQLNQKPRPGV